MSVADIPVDAKLCNTLIAHAAFFRVLGDMQPGENEWHSALAGLSVLRLVDTFKADTPSAAKTESATIESARRTATAIREGSPGRAILLRLLDNLQSEHHLSSDVGNELMAYGRSLDLEGQWSLAADVFRTISDAFAGTENVELVIKASTALGAAARNVADWNASDWGYANAQHIADVSGNRPLSLTVRVGVAASHRVHGNLPTAEAELDEVLSEARSEGFQQVEALALHDMASVAHSRGDYQRAVHLAYRSLELTTNQTARDRILGDLAAAYAGLGMKETARDGYSIIALTSPHQAVRWQATLNLMELAVDDGDENSFNECVTQMENAKLEPRLNAYQLYYKGLGFRRFERGGSDELLQAARDFASAHQFHQLAHEIEESIETGVNPPLSPADSSGEVQSEETRHVAKALTRLRENATNPSE